MLAGLTPSIGTVGNALDNALAETTIGLYKTECLRENSPFRHGSLTTLADLEEITSTWVHWYNNDRLMHRLGRRPPAEAEADYYGYDRPGQPVGTHKLRCASNRGRFNIPSHCRRDAATVSVCKKALFCWKDDG
jgi:hypothetical protein